MAISIKYGKKAIEEVVNTNGLHQGATIKINLQENKHEEITLVAKMQLGKPLKALQYKGNPVTYDLLEVHTTPTGTLVAIKTVKNKKERIHTVEVVTPASALQETAQKIK